MKKALYIILALALTLSLTACRDTGADKGDTTTDGVIGDGLTGDDRLPGGVVKPDTKPETTPDNTVEPDENTVPENTAPGAGDTDNGTDAGYSTGGSSDGGAVGRIGERVREAFPVR